MKKQPILLLLMISVFIMLTSGCERWKTIYTISGTLYQNCDMVPKADRELELYQRVSFMSNPGQTLDIVTTDSLGNYKFSYQHTKGTGDLIISLFDANFPQKLLEWVPKNRSEEFDIVVYEKATLEINLTTDTPYTENDTLYYEERWHM